MSCPLGELLDLSVGGLRLRLHPSQRLRPGERLELKLNSGSHTLTVRGVVVRAHRRGWRQRDASIRFGRLEPAERAALESLARFGFFRKKSPQGEVKPTVTVDAVAARHYAELGLSPEATMEEVRAAFRRLVRTCHPDSAATPESARRYQAISDAYHAIRRLDRQTGPSRRLAPRR